MPHTTDTYGVPVTASAQTAPVLVRADEAEAELLVVFTPGLHRFDFYRLLERCTAAKRASRRSARARNTATTSTSTARSGATSSPKPDHPNLHADMIIDAVTQ
ncbi:hypothetical protein [Nocardia spumae]|uniref:hypothetical protein n=1 Tax=Nocardia spumae TaxID=2887190 RepID=UPI001D140267|nr:hypothetical protein [Nocardia spumae]